MATTQSGVSNDPTQNQQQTTNNYENAVFVSYAWEDESERIVDELEQAFDKHNIRIVRDKKDVGFKGSIKAFEKRIGKGQCIILVVSDKYLRSEHCMYELIETEENQNLHKRIFPIVLKSARIYNAKDRLIYINYWEKKIEQLDQAIKRVSRATNIDSSQATLNKYSRIRASFDHLTDLLSDLNALTPELHATSGYSTLINAVELEMVTKAERDAFKEEILEYKRQIEQITDKKSALQKQVSELVQKTKLITNKKGALQKQVSGFEQKIEQLTKGREVLQEKVSGFEQKIEQLAEGREVLQEKVSGFEQKIEQLTEGREALQKIVSDFEQEIIQIDEERETLQKTASGFEQEIMQLIEGWNAFQKKALVFQKRIDQLEEDNYVLMEAASKAPKYHGASFKQMYRELIKYLTHITAEDIADKNVQDFINSLPAKKPSLLHFYWIFSRWIDYGISLDDVSKRPEIYNSLKKLIDLGLVRLERREQQTFCVHTEIGKSFLLELRRTEDPDAKDEIILG